MAGFMDKLLRFKTRKWRRHFVFFRHCHRWVSGATVVVMSETANINIIFASSQRWDFHNFIWILQERVVVALLRRLHRSRWGNLYLCFFSLLNVVFLALWFVMFSLSLRLVPATDSFIMLLMVFSPIGLVWTRCLWLNFRFRLLLR